MVPNRPYNAICYRSRGPLFGLFHRQRWYSQHENGIPPDTCEGFLVSGFGAPNVHPGASSSPNAQAEQPAKPVCPSLLLDETAAHGRVGV
jgi:hypothetical protein